MANYDLRPNTYVDRADGQTKSFTTIDHSKKKKVYYEDQETLDYNPEQIKEEQINELIKYPAFLCPPNELHLLIRGEGVDELNWNVTAFEPMPWIDIMFTKTLVKNGYELLHQSNPNQYPIIE